MQDIDVSDIETERSDALDAGISTTELAAELTVAWLSNPNTSASSEDVPAFFKTLHTALSGFQPSGAQINQPVFEPAVTIRKSLSSKTHVISMIDGKPYRTLKRHLATHGLTPAEYRARYKLPADYPMVAPEYAAQRRQIAMDNGLGRKPDQAAAAKAPPKSPGKVLSMTEAMAAARTRLGLKY
jgi:predicted transcriptional regulator